MFNQMERELKILVQKFEYEKIKNSYDFSNPRIQKNVYYDTPSNEIKNKGGAMRIRTINGHHFFTLKLKKDNITHYEYEKEINTDKIEQIQDNEVLHWIHSLHLKEKLIPIISFETERRMWITNLAEICADKNIFGDVIDYEIEYEYRIDHDGIQVFNDLLKPVHLYYEKNCSSKIARAMNYILCNKR
ncbi:CYTH domain-containing protein [Floccifex sp.]|uniref:CYTH domain-containing protein n=1 Tax=Floccifex sp. TaxID=2815810 RepID=UPI003EFEDFF1